MNPDQVHLVQRWIVERGLCGASHDELLQGFCERIMDAGIVLLRAFIGLDTLHPEVEGRSARWFRTSGRAEPGQYLRHGMNEAAWLQSPIYALEVSGATHLRRRLRDEYKAGEFPIVDELHALGATDYIAFRTHFEEPEPLGQIDTFYSSWATDQPGGFTGSDLALLEDCLPFLALAIKAASTAWIARNLMETYLGRDAGRRVLRGEIERGATQTIRAIIWLSDLRGFTRIADTVPREQLVPLLNDYADCLATAVHDHGGQVLKFMGDGLLATFELDGSGAACARALDAAEAALAGVEAVNERRLREELPITAFDLALHVGEVLYGNIGSWDRLDFTVVGPAVNEAARIEAMCGSLDQPVIVSSAFAHAAASCRERLVSLGRYMLRGVRRPQELFTLDPDVRCPAR